MRTPTVIQRRAPTAVAKSAISTQRKVRPQLRFMVEQPRDPIGDLDAPENDIEKQSDEIFGKLKTAYDAQEKRLTEAAKHANTVGFFTVMVFSSPEQTQAFLTAVGQSVEQQYVDGRRICDRLGIAIPADVWDAKQRATTPDKRLAALALPLKKRE